MVIKVRKNNYILEQLEKERVKQRIEDDFLIFTALQMMQEKGAGLLVSGSREKPIFKSFDILESIFLKFISIFDLPQVSYKFVTVNQLSERDNKLPVIYEDFQEYMLCNETLSEIVKEESSTRIIKATRKRSDRNVFFNEQNRVRKGDEYWDIESEPIQEFENRLNDCFLGLKESIQYKSRLYFIELEDDMLRNRSISLWKELREKEDELELKNIIISLISQLKVSESDLLDVLKPIFKDKQKCSLHEQLKITQLFVSKQNRPPVDLEELEKFLAAR